MEKEEALKQFLRKVAHANKIGLKEMKMPIEEINDLAMGINYILIESFGKNQTVQQVETVKNDSEEIVMDGGSFKKD